MAQPRPRMSVHRTRRDAIGVARLAARQHGALSRAQLRACGLGNATVARWIAAGRLHRVHPGVYAVGHTALDVGGRLFAALLYAGSGSALSHATAAWWWQLLDAQPTTIHVSGVGRRRSLPGVRMHRAGSLDRVVHRGLAVTGVAQTLLDVGSTLPFEALRRALAEAEYRRLCDTTQLGILLRRGRRGSASLRQALEHHVPELARTLSVLEERFLALCERSGLPMPEVNPTVEGMMVDALWREARLIVELDGHAAHGTSAAIERDRQRELALRSRGYTVLRYTWAQVTGDPGSVVSDLRAALASGLDP
jgi:predicted transcriptional regulator of viral defense system